MKNIKEGDTGSSFYVKRKLESGELCYKNDAENLTEDGSRRWKVFSPISRKHYMK